MVRQPIVAGNWKMYKTPTEGRLFVEKTADMVLKKNQVDIIFCPSFSALFHIKDIVAGCKNMYLGAQNCHWEPEGAFTGEVSVSMLQDCGCTHVILGHSERRHIFHEPDEWINNKIHAVMRGKLIPIFCVGETIEERNSGKTRSVLSNQLIRGLDGIETIANIVIAYEPVWAIGTGVTASSDQVVEAHALIREMLGRRFSLAEAEQTPILYGGSVKPGNAGELIRSEGVDGFLIGGASLKVETFTEIIQIVQSSI